MRKIKGQPPAPHRIGTLGTVAGKPTRVQLRRTKGWRMPPNTVSVARPTPWGNPFRITADRDRAESVRLFKNLLSGKQSELAQDQHFHAFTRESIVKNLRGKNLACWCPLDGPCHANVLLELANSDSPSEAENN